MARLRLPAMLAGVALISVLSAGAAAPGYHVLNRLRLGGPDRWDDVTLDSATRRLYISRNSRVQVLNVDTGKLIGQIEGTLGVHGIALAPGLGRGFISNGRLGIITSFDLQTLRPVAEVPAGANPDAIVYDPASEKVFAFGALTRDMTVIDGRKGKAAGTIELGSRPEQAVADGTGKIYVNLRDTGEIGEIDSRKLKLTRRFALRPCTGPVGLAMDTRRRRLFSACQNKMMAVVDAVSGRVMATPPIGKGADAAGFDPVAGYAFSASSDGTLTVITAGPAREFKAVQTVLTQRGARTMAIDLKTHRVYLPTARFGQPPAPTEQHPHPPAAILPDSFVVVVVGR